MQAPGPWGAAGGAWQQKRRRAGDRAGGGRVAGTAAPARAQLIAANGIAHEPVKLLSSCLPPPPPLSLPERAGGGLTGPASHPAPPAPYPGTWPAPRAAPSPACASPGLFGHLQQGDTVRAAPGPPPPAPELCQHQPGTEASSSARGAPASPEHHWTPPPGTHLAWAWGWQQEPGRLQPAWGGRCGAAHPSRVRLCHLGGSWHRRGPLHQQLGPGVGSRGAASLPGKGRQQYGRGLAGQRRGAMPLLWGAPSQGAGGVRGGTGHTRGRCSRPRGPQLQGWGRRAVLTALRLEGQVGHAVGCCSRRGVSRLGGRWAAWRGSRLQGRARRSFQRG